MAKKSGTSLASVPGFPPTAAAQLATLWITTAEELMSAAGQSNGRAALGAFLGLAPGDIATLVAAAEAVVPLGLPYAEEDIPLVLGAAAVEGAAPAEAEPLALAELPPSVDLRAGMPPVRSQGQRGTCVAHAVAAVREYLSGPQSTSADLSEQHLYWLCKQRDGSPQGFGTLIRVAMGALKEVGICPESVWPYNAAKVPGNEGQGPPPAGADAAAAPYRAGAVQQLEPRWVDALKGVLAKGRPVAFSVHVHESWGRPHGYRAGDIRLPLPGEKSLGAHAMCMVGYEDDATVPGGGYFVVRNSWGEQFGYYGQIAPGYCRLPYAQVRSYGIEAYTADVE